MFRYRTILLSLCCSLLAAPLIAQENGDVFLSLTRKYEPLKDLPTNVSVVSAGDISAKNAKNLGELLDSAVGLKRSETGTLGQASTLMMRGASSEQSLVLIDGRRVNNISMGTADLGTIPVDSIDHIEIVRGAASSIYGANAFGGAVNIITKRPSESVPAARLSISPASFGTYNFQGDLGIRKDAVYGMITAGKNMTKGWRQNSDYQDYNFFSRLGYNAGGIGQFDLSGSTFRNEIGVPGIAYYDPVNFILLSPDKYDGTLEKKASSPDARQKGNNDYLRLEHSKSWEINSLRTVVYASNDRLTFVNPAWAMNDDYRSTVFGGELQFNTLYDITAGAEWSEEKHLRTDLNTNTDMIDRSRINTAVYLQDELKWSKFSFIPNLRVDDNSAFGSVLSPRMTVVYQANDRVKLSANSGKVWRAPTFNELYYRDSFGTSGDPNLKPEQGISSDVGVEYSADTYKAAMTAFLADTSDLILWKYDAATFTTTATNVNKSRQEGAELVFGQKLADGLTHRLNYTYLWAEDTQAHTQLIYRPQHTANYDVTYTLPSNTRLGLGAQYVGTQKTEASYYPELPDYTVLSLTVSQRFREAEVWVKGDNLTNTKYQTRLGYPLPGIVISGGVNVRFQG